MAKKRPEPIITHAEILCLAIRTIDAEICTWRQRCEGLPEEYFDNATANLREKREALKQLYLIEVGNEYE